MTTPTTPLDVHFERVIADAMRLLAVLRHEHTLLNARDASAIEQIAQEKQQYLTQLDNSGRAHSVALRAAGFVHGAQPMQDWLRQTDKRTGSQLTPLWQRLESLLTECREQNQRNGGVIEINRRHTQRALGILLGKPEETELYNPGGATSATGYSRTLARA
jgi:flagellar biosynthesis/type III secretory pathway chaperone